jgi:hypothetical protein
MATISLNIVVDDLTGVVALYDVIQVWRSVDQSGSPAPYIAVTSDTPSPATQVGTVEGPWNLSGQSLLISLSGSDAVTVPFLGPTPIDLQTVIKQINTKIPGLAFASDGKLALVSPLSGTQATIFVTGGAQVTLGLPSQIISGKSGTIKLTPTTSLYRFRDFGGSPLHWYRTRFYSTKTGAASPFSAPQQGAPQTVIVSSFKAKAFAYLADGAGKPLIGKRIIFVPVSVSRVDVGSGMTYSALPGVDRIIATTDSFGYAAQEVIKGATYRIFFEGTPYQRELVVPNEDEFDLLEALSTSPDLFSINTAPPMPIRMS